MALADHLKYMVDRTPLPTDTLNTLNDLLKSPDESEVATGHKQYLVLKDKVVERNDRLYTESVNKRLALFSGEFTAARAIDEGYTHIELERCDFDPTSASYARALQHTYGSLLTEEDPHILTPEHQQVARGMMLMESLVYDNLLQNRARDPRVGNYPYRQDPYSEYGDRFTILMYKTMSYAEDLSKNGELVTLLNKGPGYLNLGPEDPEYLMASLVQAAFEFSSEVSSLSLATGNSESNDVQKESQKFLENYRYLLLTTSNCINAYTPQDSTGIGNTIRKIEASKRLSDEARYELDDLPITKELIHRIKRYSTFTLDDIGEYTSVDTFLSQERRSKPLDDGDLTTTVFAMTYRALTEASKLHKKEGATDLDPTDLMGHVLAGIYARDFNLKYPGESKHGDSKPKFEGDYIPEMYSRIYVLRDIAAHLGTNNLDALKKGEVVSDSVDRGLPKSEEIYALSALLAARSVLRASGMFEDSIFGVTNAGEFTQLADFNKALVQLETYLDDIVTLGATGGPLETSLDVATSVTDQVGLSILELRNLRWLQGHLGPDQIKPIPDETTSISFESYSRSGGNYRVSFGDRATIPVVALSNFVLITDPIERLIEED